MDPGKVMVFHSYKGGTGKTTLVANLAAYYAKNGYKVCLLDMDLYAPSLVSYFQITPKKYLNNLLHDESTIDETLIDITEKLDISGEFFLGLASPEKEDIQSIEIKQDQKWQLEALRRFLVIKRRLLSEYGFDYIFLDTSPGIRYWSINSLAASDILFMLMKVNNMDIVGTKKMITEIYDSLTRYGSKTYAILNKVGGASPFAEYNVGENISGLIKEVEESIGIPVMFSIPCFCDLQFSRYEFLSTITRSEHQFSKILGELVNTLDSF